MNRSSTIIFRFWITIACVAILFCACMESQEKRIERLIASGDQAFADRQYNEAVNHWQEAVRLAPDNAGILEKLGHASLRLARFHDAERYFQEAVELKPDAWTAWIEIGKLSVLSLDLQGGEDVWEMLKANRIRNPHALIYHGDLAMLKNQFSEAELDYRQALAIAPEQTGGMIKLAISLQVQGKDAQAEKIYERLASREINDPLVWIQMGHYRNLVDDFQKAEKCMKQALDLDPADLRLQVRVANFYTAAGKFHAAAMILEPILNNASLAIAKEYANLLIQQNKISDAMAFLKPLFNDHPNDDTLKLMMGKCHLLSGRAVIAASEINAVAEKNPDSPPVQYLLGVAYLAGGYNQMGIQHLTKALALDNDFSDAELALAACYYKTGEYALAREHAQRVMGKESANFRPYMIAGATYLEESEFPKAKQAFAMAANLDPDSIAPLYFSAMTDEYAGQARQAKVQYERLLSDHPMRIDVAERYNALLINNAKDATARQFLEKEAENHPDNVYILCMLGDFYASVGKPGLAMDALKNVVEIDPQLTFAYLQLAHLYQANGNLTEAIETLKNAVAVNPSFTAGMLELARFHLALGNIQDAMAVLESAYAMDRDDAAIINNLATLYLEDDGKLIQAFELAQKAYEKNNAEPAYIDTLGWAYYKKALYRQAVWYLEEAEKKLIPEGVGKTDTGNDAVLPENRESLAIVSYHLGVAMIKSGKTQIGVEKVSRAIELGLGGKLREHALMVVEEGGEG